LDGDLISTIRASVGSSFLRSLLLQATLLGSASYLTSQTPSHIKAHAVASGIWFFSSSITDSVAGGVQTLTAKERSWDVGRDGIAMGLAVGSLLAAAITLASPYLGILTPGEPAVAEDARSVIGTVAGMQVVNGIVFVGDGILQGMGMFEYEAKVMAAAAVGGTAAAAALVGGGTDELKAVWGGIAVMQGIRAAGIGAKLTFGDTFQKIRR
jgi:Na+-driven multidrug efflux pump